MISWDILGYLGISFDLMGFTSDNRISLFKSKIAPIQISWLGYCNTSGLNEMNYIFTDKNLILDDSSLSFIGNLMDNKFIPKKVWTTRPQSFKIR